MPRNYIAALALSALAAGVDGYSVPMASDPTNVRTNVRNQWDLPDIFGGVTIPGAAVTDSFLRDYYDDDEEEDNQFFFSPLQPIDPYSQDDFLEEDGYTGYESIWNNPRSRTAPLAATPPSPLSAGSVWRYNNNRFGKNTNSFGTTFNRGVVTILPFKKENK